MVIAAALTNALRTADAGPLVRELFGGGQPAVTAPFGAAAGAIVATVAPFGVPVAVVLVRASSGIVVGFDLADGRRIVVKVHRGHGGDRLGGVLRAQLALRKAALPVAEPLVLAPIPIGTGWAVVETWIDAGETLDVRQAPLRRAVANAMHDVVRTLDADTFADLRLRWTGTYPPPHSPIFDFAATASGAEWIDDHNVASIAVKTRLTAGGVGRLIVGHSDLRPENILITPGAEPRVSAIYDLDSLVADAARNGDTLDITLGFLLDSVLARGCADAGRDSTPEVVARLKIGKAAQRVFPTWPCEVISCGWCFGGKPSRT